MNDSTPTTEAGLTPRALFAVLARAIGLLLLAQAASAICAEVFGGMFGSAFTNGVLSSILGQLGGQIAVGLFLLFGTDSVLRLFYRADPPAPRRAA